MNNEQNLPGSGLNGDHVVYSSFFADNYIVQQTAIVHPKTLLIDGLRNVLEMILSLHIEMMNTAIL